MKKLFSVTNTSASTDIAILVARIGIAVLMLTHGIPKMMMLFSEEPVKFPSVFGLNAELGLGFVVFAEVFCSLLILAGFATRLATIPLIITMLVALFAIHAADPFARQEPALQYLLAYIVLLFAGSGKYSLDYLLQGVGSTSPYAVKKEQDPALAIYQ